MPATSPLGAIDDANLRLAVLDTLMAAGTLPPFDLRSFHQASTGRPWTPYADYNYRYRPEVAGALLATAVTAAQCDTVSRLTWAGGADIQHEIWGQWDGESDEFSIRSLAGIGTALPALESLMIIYLSKVTDLAPILHCGQLRSLSLIGCRTTDLGPLLDLPGNAEVVASLEERGVACEIT
jgi:hypothetical protein